MMIKNNEQIISNLEDEIRKCINIKFKINKIEIKKLKLII